MRYLSTRGDAPELEFGDVLLEGVAADGGLYVPSELPVLSTSDLRDFAALDYHEVATRVLAPFVAPSLSLDELAPLVSDAYSAFSHDDVVPVSALAAGEYLVELFWGPTLSFKDIALQLLGRLFAHELARRGDTMTVVGATSGDTGSAAIDACRDRAGISVVMLHPAGRVTEMQRRQMTTVTSANIHNVAIEGTFDDCQDLVKALFADRPYRERLRLGAVNSINWARVAAQAVYYVTTAVALGAPSRTVSFCVPTGNFGNALAGDVARRMGLPIDRLIIATNHNDILVRACRTGEMSVRATRPSTSPAMDIGVPSNFERLLFDLGGRRGHALAADMARFRTEDSLTLSSDVWAGLQAGFDAGSAGETQVAATIAAVDASQARLIDPHTAVALTVARRDAGVRGGTAPMAVMSTAHPAKFGEAVHAATGRRPEFPPALAALAEREERATPLPNDLAALRDFVSAAAVMA
ncbi:threonine synthase [Candidatus Poriferisodalis sp.]|uniref:threonine synthase n=1 Tax=Candidatus Poriferisodalis sp. TaxID=3101277 RepID=UPI003B02BDD3